MAAPPPADGRGLRLAQALRANLRRRKAAEAPAAPPAPAVGDGGADGADGLYPPRPGAAGDA